MTGPGPVETPPVLPPPVSYDDIERRRQELARRNRRTGLAVALTVTAMIALSYASVPLYRLFCKVTGFGGTTQVASAPPGTVLDRSMTIRFNADVDPALPWEFKPEQEAVTLQVGQQGLIAYRARNRADRPITGTAVYNVVPLKAGAYFHKIACFCFGEQVLAPGQEADLPVLFFVDPSIANDPNMDDVTNITLSYTFFKSDSKNLDRAMEEFYNSAGKPAAPPSAKEAKGAPREKGGSGAAQVN